MSKNKLNISLSLEYYRNKAKELHKSWQKRELKALETIRWYHPKFQESDNSWDELIKEIKEGPISLRDAQLTVARDSGYENWKALVQHINALASAKDSDTQFFEIAAQAIVDGDLDSLMEVLSEQPSLAKARSKRKHSATLLHYIAANGIENNRQKTPPNAVEIASFLLEKGADADALANTYGGGSHATILCLLVTSIQPYKARLQPDLVDALIDGGAKVNGLDDDSAPLTFALSFHYTEAAMRLYKRGARVSNICHAAGLGLLDALNQYFDPNGVLRPIALAVGLSHPDKDLDAKEIEELAFAYACNNRQFPIMEFFLDRGVDINAQHSGLQTKCTPLHRAISHHQNDVVEFLVSHGADFNTKEITFNGTPMGWAIHSGNLDAEQILSNSGAV